MKRVGSVIGIAPGARAEYERIHAAVWPEILAQISKSHIQNYSIYRHGDLLFGIDHIVWYISQFMELFPGDVINTGTPFGVAMGLNPPKYLKPGQVVKTGIEGIGEIESICMEHLG